MVRVGAVVGGVVIGGCSRGGCGYRRVWLQESVVKGGLL